MKSMGDRVVGAYASIEADARFKPSVHGAVVHLQDAAGWERAEIAPQADKVGSGIAECDLLEIDDAGNGAV